MLKDIFVESVEQNDHTCLLGYTEFGRKRTVEVQAKLQMLVAPGDIVGLRMVDENKGEALLSAKQINRGLRACFAKAAEKPAAVGGVPEETLGQLAEISQVTKGQASTIERLQKELECLVGFVLGSGKKATMKKKWLALQESFHPEAEATTEPAPAPEPEAPAAEQPADEQLQA